MLTHFCVRPPAPPLVVTLQFQVTSGGLSSAAAGTATLTVIKDPNAFSHRIKNGLLTEFDLTQGWQVNSNPSAPASDSQSTQLLGQMNLHLPAAAWIGERSGLQFQAAPTNAFRAISSRDSTQLNAALTTQGDFTLELWLDWQPLPSLPATWAAMIVALGQTQPGDPAPSTITQSCGNGNLLVFSSTTAVSLAFQSANGCTQNVITPATGTNHIVLAKSGSTTAIYLNGVLSNLRTVAYTLPLSNWNNSALLHFATPWANGGWPGKLYLFAMYNRALSAAEVSANFAAYLPNSPPVTRNQQISVNEGQLTLLQPVASDYQLNPLTVTVSAFTGRGRLQAVLPSGALTTITSLSSPAQLNSNNTLQYLSLPQFTWGNNFASFTFKASSSC